MNLATRERFRKVFEQQKAGVLFSDKVMSEDYAISSEDRMDEADLATTDVEQSMRLRLRNREILYIKKLESALKRIEMNTFGECEECGEDIELRRLEARPTATLCVSCKEEEEKRETLTISGFQHKSLGSNSMPRKSGRL